MEVSQVAAGRLPNRWFVAVAMLLMQLCLGSTYAWSVFTKPLVAMEPSWTTTQITLAFSIAVSGIGIGCLLGGMWQDKKGPRVVATFAGVLYGAGWFIASFAASHHSLWGIYFGYGVCCGLGMGFAYICPVAVITKWFPDMRGLMTGVNVMGFGASALILSPIAARLMQDYHVPVSTTLMIVGVTYLVIVVATAQFCVNPPHGWRPEGWVAKSKVSKAASKIDYTPKQALSTGRFWMLWALLSLNTSAGIMILSQASPLIQDQTGLNAVDAGAVVGIFSIFNGGGRIVFAWISDMIGRWQTYFLIFAIQIPMFFILPSLHSVVLFSIVVCIIELCYGGGFGVMPSFTADFFGPKYVGGIYGWILLGWGVASIPSPLLMAHIRQTTGTYSGAIYTIFVVLIVSLIVPLLARRETIRLAAVAKAEALRLEGAGEMGNMAASAAE